MILPPSQISSRGKKIHTERELHKIPGRWIFKEEIFPVNFTVRFVRGMAIPETE
jgi:hypothetical protein